MPVSPSPEVYQEGKVQEAATALQVLCPTAHRAGKKHRSRSPHVPPLVHRGIKNGMAQTPDISVVLVAEGGKG